MENEESWNTFARTGKVSDYLKYAGSSESCSSRNFGEGIAVSGGIADSRGEGAGSGRERREGTA